MTGLRNLRLAVALTVGLATAGCTGESSFDLPPVDAGAPGARNEVPCAAWAKTRCAYEERCQASIYARWEDEAQCLARRTLQCELVAADPSARFDADAVIACTYPTDCTYGTPGLCLQPGRLAVGAPCQWNEACASGACGLTYINVSPSPCGVCEALQTCTLTCASNEACEIEADGGDRCVTEPTAGEACTAPDYFCSNASCEIGNFGSDGVCAPLAVVDQPCGPAPAGPVCDDPTVDSFCDDTGHCRAFLPADYGQTCGEGDGGDAYLCTAYGVCDPSGVAVCVPPAADGALCDDAQGLSCLPPARCRENHCVFPDPSSCTAP